MLLKSIVCLAVMPAVLMTAIFVQASTIPVANHSFEFPVIDPNENPFLAIPVAPFWILLDLDDEYGSNTGIFRNTPPDSPYGDHIFNADGDQLAFLGSQTGNAFLQDLSASYEAGKGYRMTVEVCPSMRHPPAGADPNNALSLEFYYMNNEPNLVTLCSASVPSTALTQNYLKTFSMTLPLVEADHPCVGQFIGIAIRADGAAGGYWDLDNVRVTEYFRVPELSGDSFVNLDDFAILAAEWQSCDAVTADLTGDGCVSIGDLWILADFWLEAISVE